MEQNQKLIPVIEIFGPVIQGEGAMAGQQTYFLRTGGCDYRCSWCDTMYAVLPEQVKKNSEYLSQGRILEVLETRSATSGVKTLTISGGNPVMHDLQALVTELRVTGWYVAVETQGSLWKYWLRLCDMITISPKPPSSGMQTDIHDALFDRFMKEALTCLHEKCLKIVVFDEVDYFWAREIMYRYRLHKDMTFYLQPGTKQPEDGSPSGTRSELSDLRNDLLERTTWLIDRVTHDHCLSHVRVMPQVHSLVYGYARGV